MNCAEIQRMADAATTARLIGAPYRLADGDPLHAIGLNVQQAIRRNLKLCPLMIHYVIIPVIDVDGDRAVGRWAFLRPHTTPPGNVYLAGGWYSDEYVWMDRK